MLTVCPVVVTFKTREACSGVLNSFIKSDFAGILKNPILGIPFWYDLTYSCCTPILRGQRAKEEDFLTFVICCVWSLRHKIDNFRQELLLVQFFKCKS